MIKKNSQSLTSEELEEFAKKFFDGLRHITGRSYFDWLDRTGGTPTHKEIEDGLANTTEEIRDLWYERGCKWIEQSDFTPTPEQIDRGLKDNSERARSIWMRIAKWQLCASFDDNDSATFQSI